MILTQQYSDYFIQVHAIHILCTRGFIYTISHYVLRQGIPKKRGFTFCGYRQTGSNFTAAVHMLKAYAHANVHKKISGYKVKYNYMYALVSTMLLTAIMLLIHNIDMGRCDIIHIYLHEIVEIPY